MQLLYANERIAFLPLSAAPYLYPGTGRKTEMHPSTVQTCCSFFIHSFVPHSLVRPYISQRRVDCSALMLFVQPGFFAHSPLGS